MTRPLIIRGSLERFWTSPRRELAARLRPAIATAVGIDAADTKAYRATAEVMRILAEEKKI